LLHLADDCRGVIDEVRHLEHLHDLEQDEQFVSRQLDVRHDARSFHSQFANAIEPTRHAGEH